jgi:hypothetical protein
VRDESIFWVNERVIISKGNFVDSYEVITDVVNKNTCIFHESASDGEVVKNAVESSYFY